MTNFNEKFMRFLGSALRPPRPLRPSPERPSTKRLRQLKHPRLPSRAHPLAFSRYGPREDASRSQHTQAHAHHATRPYAYATEGAHAHNYAATHEPREPRSLLKARGTRQQNTSYHST